MDDITRAHYLQAMGIDAYVARGPLPGAAASRPVVRVPVATPRPAAVSAGRPVPEALQPATPPPPEAATPPAGARPQAAGDLVNFNLAAVVAGGLIWVEQLQGRPLAREQVRLIHAMARAIGGPGDPPRVGQFDWPMHRNPQLDLGLAAARDGVAAFLRRQLDEQGCRALVLLGEDCERFVAKERLEGVVSIRTCSTLDMLEDPSRKPGVWRDLQPLRCGG